ncbi:MAG: sigma factor-like helix-turn-helix DNA-binding protein [Candidatus Coprovivens sp.]
MKEFVYYNSLFDIYGKLLTDKEQESFRDYYQEDLSLGEIAEIKNISRAAVQKTIKTVLEKLDYYEDILNIYKKNMKLKEVYDMSNDEEIKNKIEEILG